MAGARVEALEAVGGMGRWGVRVGLRVVVLEVLEGWEVGGGGWLRRGSEVRLREVVAVGVRCGRLFTNLNGTGTTNFEQNDSPLRFTLCFL